MSSSVDIQDLTKITHGFRLAFDTKAKAEFQHWVTDTRKDLNAWSSKLREALSDPLPRDQVGKRRKERSRWFPYMTTGKDVSGTHLRDDFKVGKGVYSDIKSGYKYTVGITLPTVKQFHTTNEAQNSNPDDPPPRWKGWADDVFQGKGRNGVKGLKSVFNKATRKKKGIL